ncbi:MAG: SurA N-terminal domain-containing protein [Candidatus Microsaccharimonas sp.]
MKKLLNKIRRKGQPEEPGRITTETIVEHRERMLAGGRRFKYPVQYARHRLVINAILISVGVIILLVGFVGWQLYFVQNTSDFMYRVTKVIPVPVARVENQEVRYSDYLMKYRSSIHYLQEKEQVNLNTEDGRRQSDFVKQQAMEDAIADAYALKIAKEKDLSVSDVELEAFLKSQRNSSDGAVSETTYDAVILDYYGWSPEEYRHAMKTKLLRQKAAYAVDTTAEKASLAVGQLIANGNTDLKSVAETYSQSGDGQAVYGALGWVPRNNQDGGLATAAALLQKGGISPVIKSTTGDGYYYVKLIDINDSQVNFEYVHIPLTVFAKQIAGIKDNGKVTEYISIPDVEATNQ